MLAGIWIVCNDASIQDMQKSIGDALSMKVYPKGTHSIHNSMRNEFMADTLQVIDIHPWSLGSSVQKVKKAVLQKVDKLKWIAQDGGARV